MRKIIKNNWLIVSFAAIVLLILVNIWITIRNNKVIEQNSQLEKHTEEVKLATQGILNGTVHTLDLGVRGYALTKDTNLLSPYKSALVKHEPLFRKIDSLLREQKYDKLDSLQIVKHEVDKYIQFMGEMVALAEKDSMAAFTKMLKQDKGYDVWVKYAAFEKPVFAFQDQIKYKAQQNYQTAMYQNILIQIILLIITLPTVYFIIYRLRKESKERRMLLLELENYNQNYFFHSRTQTEQATEEISVKDILDNSIQNIRRASDFVKNIANGNYSVTWEGMTEAIREKNTTTLAGELLQMKEQMQQVKEEDQKRNWINEGLSYLGEILRKESDLTKISDRVLAELIKYLNANQGALFILQDENPAKPVLQLRAAYAYNRKKYLNKEIAPGEGLAGQAWQEADTIYLTQIPQDYIKISSGLGDARPNNLLIVPLKYDDKIQGVIELASFKTFQPHEIAFVEKLGESMAVTFASAKISEKTSRLLVETQHMTELMRAQEEEMRQNMEEMMATQEEMERKRHEYMQQVEQLKMENDELKKMVIA
ncbi:GAF domain-containing protein [Xanthocytophaga flava]|uniref:GAF domain-containing protein n=1 Tax=Xanthocytophaga flava TaxID=3048013 RepID=UPI0028D3F6F2|nr:GAF domain-containing protein [Xanthocytophaga flavus]MDJ1473518.1 GAF domain-containing protein [Xanthocytophaga flavus]